MGSAVLPGFLIWDRKLKKHRLRVEPPVPIVNTGDREADIRTNTTRINEVIEEKVRKYPDQWLWVHRRWKTRPVGEPDLYS
jgi:KDO2-lipid IV(A) lauroyltransferase